jgi:hypothetical protein
MQFEIDGRHGQEFTYYMDEQVFLKRNLLGFGLSQSLTWHLSALRAFD